jgi:hypothetical protein
MEMNIRNIVRTYNYLSPRQKMVTAIAAVVGGGVLLCIPLLSLQPPRAPVASSTGGAGNPNGGQNPSGEADVVASQASPLDTANPIDLPADSIGTTGSDSFGSGNNTNSLSGDGSNTLDTAAPLDERVGNRQRSSASLNDTLSNNLDNPYSQSTVGRYQTPASIGNSSYSASPGSSNLSTTYSRSAGGGSSMSQSSSRLSNLEPAKGNDFTYLNPFSPNSGAGTTGANSSATSLPGNASAIPSQGAIAPSGLNGTGQGGMNPTTGNGGSTGTTGNSGRFPSSTTAPDPMSQNSNPSTPSR